MAGQPRTRGVSAKRQRVTRPKRRREQFADEIRTAHTAADRLMAATDYVRGALKRRNPDRMAAERRVDEITRQLIEVGNELFRLQAKEPKNFRSAA